MLGSKKILSLPASKPFSLEQLQIGLNINLIGKEQVRHVALSSGLIAKGQNGDEMVDFDFQFYSVAIVKDLTYHHHY
jgi:hypothetical protein